MKRSLAKVRNDFGYAAGVGSCSERTGWAGRNAAATSPTIPMHARTIIAAAYDVFPRLETRIVPATAAPRDEPRLETERDKPEISPCSSSGKADCTTLTDGVSIAPTPRPISKSPGANAHGLGEPFTIASRTPMPAIVATEPAMMRERCWYRLASRSAASDEAKMPAVAAVK